MPASKFRSDRIMETLLLGCALCFGGGCVGGCAGFGIARTTAPEAFAYSVPMPYHHPPEPGAPSFRFVMVHDVIHERYTKHGPAYYRHRAPGSTIDQAVALHHTGRTNEAIVLLQAQPHLSRAAKSNLGTMLVLANQADLVTDERARVATRTGWKYLDEVAFNATHAWRCVDWEARLVKHLLDAANDPAILTKRDMLGNELGRLPAVFPDADEPQFHMRPVTPLIASVVNRTHPQHPTTSEENMARIARSDDAIIRRVGNEHMGKDKGYMFDEPMLGLVAYWRQVGPNPHVALSMGETMLRVGQRYIAWTCYERAARLAPQFWPTPDGQASLRRHCAERQRQIEAMLPPDQVAKLRSRFERELAHGERYQRAYQAFEVEQIAAGIAPEAPHFYDAFHRSHPPIATKPGPEEWYTLSGDYYRKNRTFGAFFFSGATGGLTVLLVLVVYHFTRWWRLRRRTSRAAQA